MCELFKDVTQLNDQCVADARQISSMKYLDLSAAPNAVRLKSVAAEKERSRQKVKENPTERWQKGARSSICLEFCS